MEQILVGLLSGCFAILIAVLGFNVKQIYVLIRDIQIEIKATNLRIDGEDGLKAIMNTNHLEIIGMLTTLERKMLTDFVPKSECYFKHKENN